MLESKILAGVCQLRMQKGGLRGPPKITLVAKSSKVKHKSGFGSFVKPRIVFSARSDVVSF